MSQQQCGALTKRGTACRAFVPPGKSACVSHDPEMAAMVKAAQIKGGSAAARLRMLQGRRLKLDTAGALVKFTAGLVQDCLAGTVETDTARAVLYGVGIQKSLIEVAELEARLAALELATRSGGRRR